jgi:hypothetical protein
VRRIVVIALSVILALVVAIPIASGKPAPTGQKPSPPGQLKKNLPALTAESWNWAASMDPSPLEGEYSSPDPRCNGEYVKGVFFLAGAAFDPNVPSVERTCTVPRNTPILFSPFGYLCSAAFDPIQEVDDPQPYDTACATPTTDATIDPPSSFYARVDGKDANQQRIASGVFQWTIAVDNALGIAGLNAGTYPAAQDGLWVFLGKGLKRGEHTIEFGPTGDLQGADITYKLTAVNKAGR